MGGKNAVEREIYGIDLGGVYFRRGSLHSGQSALVAERRFLNSNESQQTNAMFRPWLRQLGR